MRLWAEPWKPSTACTLSGEPLPNWPVSLAVILKFVAPVVIPAVGSFRVQQLLAAIAAK